MFPFFWCFFFLLPEEKQKTSPIVDAFCSLYHGQAPRSPQNLSLCKCCPCDGAACALHPPSPGWSVAQVSPHIPPPSAWGSEGLPCTILRQLCALVPSSSSHSLIYLVYLSLLQPPFTAPDCSDLWSLHSSHSSGGAAGHREGLSPSLGHSR